MHKQAPNPEWAAGKKNIRYSAYKLVAVANLIQGKHLFDALNILSHTDKKGGPLVRSVLNAARKNGEKQGYTDERMYVRTITVGKALSHKKIDIKGRGKMGVIRVPKASIRLTMEEKTATDAYKEMLKGETPPGMAHAVRRMLY